MIVDSVSIAIRALSPAVNDPATAVRTLDQFDDVLNRLARLNLGDGVVRDERGEVRVRFPAPAWPDPAAATASRRLLPRRIRGLFLFVSAR